jgi:citrate synthase
MTQTGTAAPKAAGEGLEDMVAGKSAISTIDGKKGVLTYRGISIHDLADHSNYEETVFLLWYGRLPKPVEMSEFTSHLRAEARLPESVAGWLKTLPPSANPMSLLRTGVSLLGLVDRQENAKSTPDAGDTPGNLLGQLGPGQPGFGPAHPSTQKAIRLTGQLVALVAAIQRLIKGQPFVQPAAGKSLAYNFLLQMTGQEPDAETVKIFDTCLVLHADHEFNASTFTARVSASTLTDLHSAVVAAVCALKGPLHGGANTEVMHMLLEVRDPAKAKEWVKDALTQKKKIMGFGHRMYKGEDPRATHLRKMSEYLCKKVGKPEWYLLSKNIEDAMWELKTIKPNVDFYSASTYYCLGIDPDLYTPIFAMSRISGWIAHALEQQGHNRIMRPVADYVGLENVPYVAIEKR